MAFLRCLSVPLGCFHVVLVEIFAAFVVAVSKAVHGLEMAFLCCLGIPFGGLGHAFLYAIAFFVAESEGEHAVGAAFAGCFGIPLGCLGEVFGDSLA